MNNYRPVEPASERYGRLRVQTVDLSPARWLTEGATAYGEFATVAAVAAPGFAAYARILHPASLNERPVRWSTVAAAYERKMTPDTRWHELMGRDLFDCNTSEYAIPGVWDADPDQGPTPPAVARALIPVLTRHTLTPDRCWFGLWKGYGGRDFERFPSFETPGRDEVLLAGTLADAVSPVSMDEFAELPDLWWPQDRAWCLGGDTDLMSTYIGGTPALIDELLASPELEAHPVASGDRLG